MKTLKPVLFIILISLFCGIASATEYSGTLDFNVYGELGPEALAVGVTPRAINTGWNLIVDDLDKIGEPYYFKFENVEVEYTGLWADIPTAVGGPFYINTSGIYGTGGFYIFKTATTGRANMWMVFDDNFCPPVGTHPISIYTETIGNYYTFMHSSSSDPTRVQWWKDEFGMAFAFGTTNPIGFDDGSSGNAYLYTTGRFINEYVINLTGSFGAVTINREIDEATITSSAFIYENSTGYEYYNSGYETTNETYNTVIPESGYFYIEPEVDGVKRLILQTYEVPDFESEGTIDFNQTRYTDPENIQVNISLSSYDFDNYDYFIAIDTSVDLDTWHMATGNYNDSIEITAASSNRTFDFLSEYYSLPVWIRASLKEYNPLNGEYTYVDYSPAVMYNPANVYDYTVTGMVFDAYTFSPVSGATVTAEGPIDTSATTTVAGRFTLYLVGGSYDFTASKSGYVDCVNEDIIISTNISQYNFYLTSTSVTNGTINGIIRDADTDDALDDVHIIFTNDTDRIDLYSTSTGYYSGSGFAQSDTYDIRAIKSGYYAYNGSVTIAASGGTNKNFDMVQINYTATATPTPIDTYPGGSGHAWTNDEITTMLRVLVPGIFLLMLIFLLMAVMTGFSGSGGNGGLGTLWRRY